MYIIRRSVQSNDTLGKNWSKFSVQKSTTGTMPFKELHANWTITTELFILEYNVSTCLIRSHTKFECFKCCIYWEICSYVFLKIHFDLQDLLRLKLYDCTAFGSLAPSQLAFIYVLWSNAHYKFMNKVNSNFANLLGIGGIYPCVQG